MGKCEPSEREKHLVFETLPATKEHLIEIITVETGLSEKYARSLVWNMKRLAKIYTSENHLIKRV